MGVVLEAWQEQLIALDGLLRNNGVPNSVETTVDRATRAGLQFWFAVMISEGC